MERTGAAPSRRTTVPDEVPRPKPDAGSVFATPGFCFATVLPCAAVTPPKHPIVWAIVMVVLLGAGCRSTPSGEEYLATLPTERIVVDGASWLVAVADTPAVQRRGLMFVDDLGELDGMLFVFDTTTTGTFWMKDTALALDIAFFRSDGTLVDRFTMAPCDQGDDCPSYRSAAAYRFALEAPAGVLSGLADDATLIRDR